MTMLEAIADSVSVVVAPCLDKLLVFRLGDVGTLPPVICAVVLLRDVTRARFCLQRPTLGIKLPSS
jgi:hypothetical protein